jgi:ABC-2 type transport system permease protein
MVRLLAVIERDLKKFKRNPIVIAMSVIMPILYLVILGNSFQGKLKSLPLVVVDQSSGPYSKRLMENLRAVEAGPETFTLINQTDEGDAVEGVRQGRYKAALIIPHDFDMRVSVKNRAEVGLFLDNTDSISADTLRSYIGGAFRFLDPEYVAVREG